VTLEVNSSPLVSLDNGEDVTVTWTVTTYTVEITAMANE